MTAGGSGNVAMKSTSADAVGCPFGSPATDHFRGAQLYLVRGHLPAIRKVIYEIE
jgi:hypothetical protein